MTFDVTAFFRGEVHADADAIRAAFPAPLRAPADAWLLGPDAVGPAGWSATPRHLVLAEPVAHPLAPERTLSVLPILPGDRVHAARITQLLAANARVARLLSIDAPEVILENERAQLALRVAGLFGVAIPDATDEEESDEPPDDTGHASGSIVAAFSRALAARREARAAGPARELRVGSTFYDEAVEALEITVWIRRVPDGAWVRDGATLHASPEAATGGAEDLGDAIDRYAELWLADLAAHVAHDVVRHGDGPLTRLDGFPPTFAAIDLLERLAEDGPPEPPELAPFHIDALVFAPVPELPPQDGKLLRGRSVFACYAIGNDHVVLADTTREAPWADAFIALVHDGRLVPILVSDEAGGTSHAIDGDPYRLRLVLAALRDAVARAGLARTVHAPLPVPVDVWLSFDLPDPGERFVDPRQWWVVDFDDPFDDAELPEDADRDEAVAIYHAVCDLLGAAAVR